MKKTLVLSLAMLVSSAAVSYYMFASHEESPVRPVSPGTSLEGPGEPGGVISLKATTGDDVSGPKFTTPVEAVPVGQPGSLIQPIPGAREKPDVGVEFPGPLGGHPEVGPPEEAPAISQFKTPHAP